MTENVTTNRKDKAKESNGSRNETINEKDKKELKYGPMPRFPRQRMWSRGILLVGVAIYMWYYAKEKKEIVLASQKEALPQRGQSFECDAEYSSDIAKYPGCAPRTCGRFVTDKLVSANEAKTLLAMAKQGMALGGSSGGASILDIHSGALSYGDKFINVHTLPDSKKVYSAEFMTTYQMVKDKIQHSVAEFFNVEKSALHLTYPTFFSRLTNVDPKTPHDEYWHEHIDKVTYESFHYTSLLYLTDYNIDFKGGRFIFKDDRLANNVTVEPRLGRVSMFTSGAENVHFVERVVTGTRYAITVSFTCDSKYAIPVPQIIP